MVSDTKKKGAGLRRPPTLRRGVRQSADKSASLMEAMDAINKKIGKGALQVGSTGKNHSWAMKRGNLSPEYTTDFDGLISAN